MKDILLNENVKHTSTPIVEIKPYQPGRLTSMKRIRNINLMTPSDNIVPGLNNTMQVNHYRLEEKNIPHVKIQDNTDLQRFYKFGEKIGQGAFGLVISVINKLNEDDQLAMKIVCKNNYEGIKFIRREIQILKLIDHPHVVRLFKIYESPRKIYLIMEKCHQLARVFKERKRFTEIETKKIISELVETVAYLHKYDIVHRDLKLDNILLGANPNNPNDPFFIKISDFGLSIIKCGSGIDSMLDEFCGTIYYMAPELVTKRTYSQQCDIWSIGIIMYMLLIGSLPFFSHDKQQLQTKICKDDYKLPADISISYGCKHLLNMLLVKNPVDRITALEVLQHPWVLNKPMNETGSEKTNNILQKMKNWRNEMGVCKDNKEIGWTNGSDDTIDFEQMQRLMKEKRATIKKD